VSHDARAAFSCSDICDACEKFSPIFWTVLAHPYEPIPARATCPTGVTARGSATPNFIPSLLAHVAFSNIWASFPFLTSPYLLVGSSHASTTAPASSRKIEYAVAQSSPVRAHPATVPAASANQPSQASIVLAAPNVAPPVITAETPNHAAIAVFLTAFVPA
jgi:hypothetical protein